MDNIYYTRRIFVTTLRDFAAREYPLPGMTACNLQLGERGPEGRRLRDGRLPEPAMQEVTVGGQDGWWAGLQARGWLE